MPTKPKKPRKPAPPKKQVTKKPAVKKPVPNPVGRPTEYDVKYCKQIITHMSRGFSIAAFGGKIGVCKDTIYEWAKVHKEFSDSIKIGRAKAVYYWESVGMLGMMGKVANFNAPAWIFNMKNRLGWSEKLTVDPEDNYLDEEEKQVEETPVQTLQRLVKKYGKQIPPAAQPKRTK